MCKSIMILAVASFASFPVLADEATQNPSQAVQYSELKTPSVTSLPGSGQATVPGFYAGFRMGSYNTSAENLSFDSSGGVVLGYGTSAIGFEMEVNASNASALGVPMSYSTVGFYVTSRTTSKYFLKVRAGLVEQSFEADLSRNSAIRVDSDYGFSASFGGGVRISSQALIDIDATLVDQDLTVLSLGINYFF